MCKGVRAILLHVLGQQLWGAPICRPAKPQAPSFFCRAQPIGAIETKADPRASPLVSSYFGDGRRRLPWLPGAPLADCWNLLAAAPGILMCGCLSGSASYQSSILHVFQQLLNDQMSMAL